MVPSPDDEQVAEQLMVLRAQLGSREAFSRLAARYDARLLFYVRRLLGPFREADAEDLRQEIWLIVLRKLRSLDEPAAFRTWLYRVARHAVISFLRRRRAEVPLDELAPREEPQAPDDGEQDLAFTAADAQAVYLALDRLSPSHREVLTLRFLGDLSYEQVADVLGCRVGTVRSRIHYAKAALRAVISAEPTIPDAAETLIPEAGGLHDRPT
jgi:RNA polymerase sigma-70 factor (ECF subfamily)